MTLFTKKTAGFSLDLGNGKTLERRVAAKNPDDIFDKTPQITVQEALKIAFGAIEKSEKDLVVYDKKAGKRYLLNERAISVIFDEKTRNIVQKQIENDDKVFSFYDAIIDPNMAVHLNLAQAHTDFYYNIQDLYINPDQRTVKHENKNVVSIGKNTNNSTIITYNLSKNVLYRVSLKVKCTPKNIGSLSISSGNKNTLDLPVTDRYRKLEFTSEITDEIKLHNSECDMLLDEVTIHPTHKSVKPKK